MALGRGLASLIPRRSRDEAEKDIERIDSVEDASDRPVIRPLKPAPVEKAGPPDAGPSESVPPHEPEPESPPPPRKPLVTPLTIDPATGQVAPSPRRGRGRPRKYPVAESAVAPVPTPAPTPAGQEQWRSHEEEVQFIAIGDIDLNPLQPRRSFDPLEMEELKASIKVHGILQPLVVNRRDSRFILVTGERRLRAAKELGWERVPAVVRTEVAEGGQRLELALIENLQREDLNPIEVALAYQRLSEEFGMTHEEIGKRLGTTRVTITNALRVLQLPAEIQRGLAEGKIKEGHAHAILMIPDEQKQLVFYRHLLEEGLTVRKAETRARRIQYHMQVNDPLRKRTRGRHALAIRYDGQLEDKYGQHARVTFSHVKNRFEVTFFAYSEEECEDLLKMLLSKDQSASYPADEVA